ncbi:MAG: GldG family protein [Candidatus Wallbacteria bacterium]|nr:GldG family protein [Candidatus Wallbacteria bacterium]
MEAQSKTSHRRRGSGGPASSPTFPIGVLLWFIALALAVAGEGMGNWAIGAAVAGAACVGWALTQNYSWIEQTFLHRRFALGINNLILILGVTGILGLLNVIAYRHNAQYDFTKDRKFSLSDQTLKILGGLDQSLEVMAFFIEGSPDDQRGQRAGQERTMVKNLLERYAAASPKFTFRMIDPEKDPTLTKQFNITYNGTTILKSSTRDVRIEPDKMFEYNRSMFNQRLQAFNGEQVITSSILDLTSGAVRTVVFLEGHGERTVDSEDRGGLAAMKEYLLRDQYKIDKVNLLTKPEIPAGASVLVIAAPKGALDSKEIAIIDKHMADGKAVLFLLDSDTPPTLRALLKKYGVETSRTLVVDPARHLHPLFGGTPVIPQPEFGSHPLVDPLKEKKRSVLMPWSTLLKGDAANAEVKGLTYHELLKTSGDSWAEVDVESNTAQFDNGKDTKGPCTVAYAIGKEESTPPANPGEAPKPAKVTNRLIVFGSVEFASNAWAEKGGNIDLFMNAVNWLSGETDRISIRPKSEDVPKLEVEVAQYANRILYATMLLLPGFIFGLGGWIWWRRSSL